MELAELNVKLYADGARVSDIIEVKSKFPISGFTTNPSLMRKAGATNYTEHCKSLLDIVDGKPISFEVLSDEIDEMYLQATKIAEWGDNVFCKIPVSNTKGESSAGIVKKLTENGVKVNVTAIFTIDQVQSFISAISDGVPCNLSIFAGRIADTGRSATSLIQQAVTMAASNKNIEIIWASPRELYNVIEADQAGCHIITATGDILKKLSFLGYDLNQFSLDTVQMFLDDSQNAGYSI